MRVALIYNPASGRHVSVDSLRKLIEHEGHELVRVVTHHGDKGCLADPPAELVVAAGGDGTVAEAVLSTVGRGVPLTVLPLGTANNIAFTLGIGGPLEQLARSWPRAEARPFDVGLLHGAGETRRFVEGVGSGLVEACMASFRRRPLRRGEPPPRQLVRALRRYAETVARLRSRRWTLQLDGRPVSGEFLLVEVLNTKAVGPNLELAPGASVSDGALTVVTATERDRAALGRYIADRLAGREGTLELPAVNARRVEIADVDALHLDDTVVRFPAPATAAICVHAAAVTVLVPPPV